MNIAFKIDGAIAFSDMVIEQIDGSTAYTFPPVDKEYGYALLSNDSNEKSLKSPFLFCSKDGEEYSVALCVCSGEAKYSAQAFEKMTIEKLFSIFG